VSAGLKSDRRSTDVIVASQSQSLLFYLPGASPSAIDRLVRVLVDHPAVEAIFTRGGGGGLGRVPGTFSFDLIGAANPSRSADVIAALSWDSSASAFGVPGTQTINSATTGPLRGGASGHGGISPWVVRNTFIAAGPDVRARGRLDPPVSLADVVPTVRALLGIEPAPSGPGRGRVLVELLQPGSRSAVTRRTLRAADGDFETTVDVTSIDGHDYVDRAFRVRTPR
jgi:arylsulfatase A-like enzyme